MHKSPWLFPMLLVGAWWLQTAEASACTCVMPTLDGGYGGADHVIHAKVLRREGDVEQDSVYTVLLLEPAFKGCLGEGDEVRVATAPALETCGVPMPIDADLVLFALDGEGGEAGMLRVSLCGGSAPWSTLTAAQQDDLRGREVCCGDACACANGEPEVQCFVDPCSVSSCDAKGARCTADYCGGCHARWYDAKGARVCAPPPSCEDDRRYFAKSREACKAVRFACAEDEAMFIDDCGCGCAKAAPAP